MVKIKLRTSFDNDCNKFITRSGNGKAVPQYEFVPKYGRRQGYLKPKVDKDGKRVYKNLYKEIQEAGIGTDIASQLVTNPEVWQNFGEADQRTIDLKDRGGDITNFADYEWDDYLNDTAKLRAKYGELSEVEKRYKADQDRIAKIIKQREDFIKEKQKQLNLGKENKHEEDNK